MIALFLILLRVMHTLCTFERQTTSFDQVCSCGSLVTLTRATLLLHQPCRSQ